MRDPQEHRVRDHAHANEEHDVTDILWVPREPAGSVGHEPTLQSRRVLPAHRDHTPRRQHAAEQRQRDPDDEPEGALEDPGVPAHEEEQEVDATHRVEAGPGQEVLPGTTTRWRPDSPLRDGRGPDCSRQRGNEDGDGEENV